MVTKNTFIWGILRFVLCLKCIYPQIALSGSIQGAVVTRVEGDSQILIKKTGKEATPSGTTAIIFENQAYFVRPVKNGDRPANGDVVTTGKNGKVRLIFRNGDQVTVTPGTAFKFSWDAKTDKNALAELVYGDIRAVIQPEGPRSGMKVQTKTTVLGVRGTDFYASAWSREAGSRVSVMRGKIAVLPQNSPADVANKSQDKKNSPPPKEVYVEAGGTGVVKPQVKVDGQKTTENVRPSIVIKPTSQQELIVIQKDSKVSKSQAKAVDKNDPVAKEIASLEQASVETSLQDVKAHDPQLYAKLVEEAKNGNSVDADQIQAETVKKIFLVAPSNVKEAKKPTINDLESGEDIYDKYKWQRE